MLSGFTEVNRDTPRGKAIAERSAAKGKPNYSIYELLLDLESMSFGDAIWEFGNWGNDDWMEGPDGTEIRPPGWEPGKPRQFTELSQDFQTTMEFCIKKISTNLMKSNLSTMGFAIMARDANKVATFEVNNARYMTYPWTNPETKAAAEPGLDGDGRLNYLLYLETVGTHTPPLASAKESILGTRMGNWTDGRKPGIHPAHEFGTYILSYKNFMEDFIIPKLQDFTHMLSLSIYDLKAWADWKFPYLYHRASIGLGMGVGDSKDTAFAMKKHPPPTGKDDWLAELKEIGVLSKFRESPGNGATVWTYQKSQWGDKERLKDEAKASTGTIWVQGQSKSHV